MTHKLLVVALGIALGVGAEAAIHYSKVSVKLITGDDIQEKLDDEDARVMIGRRQTGLCHRHQEPGPVYALEGEYDPGVDDQPTVIPPGNRTRSTTTTSVSSLIGRISLGSLGGPEDAAGFAVFLALSDASHLAGATYFIDGGLTWIYEEQ